MADQEQPEPQKTNPGEPPKVENEKEYSLKPVEVNLINHVRQQTQGIISLVLSYIASDRLAYRLTQRTQFRINGDKIYISELAEPKVPVAKAKDNPAESPVKQSEGGQTAEAK